DVITDSPCDACLRANATQLGSSEELPEDEGLINLNVWHTSAREIVANYKITLGVVRAATGSR
ncbi:MAG: hypothetical protein SGPRY_013941, partial [Prymnesium sp.]